MIIISKPLIFIIFYIFVLLYLSYYKSLASLQPWIRALTRVASHWRPLPPLPKKVASCWAAPGNIQIYRLSRSLITTSLKTYPLTNLALSEHHYCHITFYSPPTKAVSFFIASYYCLLNFKC